MPLTEHQLKHASHNVDLDDPAWIDSSLAVCAEALGLSEEDTDEHFPAEVRLGMIEDACDWGPHATGEEVLWSLAILVQKCWRQRPKSGFDEEDKHPHPMDVWGKALQLGRTEVVRGALTEARERAALREDKESPKEIRLRIKADVQALHDAVAGVVKRGPPAPLKAGGRP